MEKTLHTSDFSRFVSAIRDGGHAFFKSMPNSISTHFCLVIVCTLLSTVALAQEEEETDPINSGTITVVRPYSPTISDAFKVKEVPALGEDIEAQRVPVQYSIFSVPVASTFTPAKGQAAKVEKAKPIKLYDNYARLGVGNYFTILAEFYSDFELSREENLGVSLNHLSSQGGIDDVNVDDDYYTTALNLNYRNVSRDASWRLDLDLGQRAYNFYGIYEPETVQVDDDLDVQQNYLEAGLGGELSFKDAILDKMTARLDYWQDDFDSTELRLQFAPQVNLTLFELDTKLGIGLDYLNGEISEGVATNYQYLAASLPLQVSLHGDNYEVSIGARPLYLQDLENEEGKFYVYPDITASYALAGDYATAFASIGGGLDWNDKKTMTQWVPQLDPSTYVFPTDRVVDAVLGLRGQLSDALGYRLQAGYKIENDKPIIARNFRELPLAFDDARDPLSYGNIYTPLYTDTNTLEVTGALNVTAGRSFELELSGSLLSYDVAEDGPAAGQAGHLPSFTAQLDGRYKINDKLTVKTQVFFVGEREGLDFVTLQTFNGGLQPAMDDFNVDLDSYVDLNLSADYRINDRWGAFVRGNNLLGENYERFAGTPVQGLQVLGGVSYRFDW